MISQHAVTNVIRNDGFITNDDELAAVIKENRLMPIIVRCGNGRFVCPAQDVKHFIKIINDSGMDHVRDISIKPGAWGEKC